MEVHYFMNGAFLEEGQILKPENIAKLRNIRCKYPSCLITRIITDCQQAV